MTGKKSQNDEIGKMTSELERARKEANEAQGRVKAVEKGMRQRMAEIEGEEHKRKEVAETEVLESPADDRRGGKKRDGLESAAVSVGKWLMLIVAVVGFLYILASTGGGESGGEQLNTMFLRLTILLGAALLFVGWNVIRKMKYQKEVVSKVFAEFVTKEGNSYTKLLPMDSDGMVLVKPRKRKARMYALEDLGTYAASYPPGKWSFLQTQVKKTLLDEDSFEPLSNRRGIIALSPMRLFNLANERFSSLGVTSSQDEVEHKGVVKKPMSGNMLMWIVIAMVGLGMVGIIYFVMSKWGEISAGLGV